MEQVFTAMKPINDTIHSVVDKMLEGKEEVGPDDALGPMAILVRMIAANHPGLDRLLEAFYARKDVKEKLDERDEFVKSSLHASKAFEIFASDPKIYTSAEKEAILHERLFVSPCRIEAFNAAGGAERATAAGYHPSEFYRLAQAFGLYKAATNCSDAEALDAVLDPQSKARRLLDYGGRFTANAKNFAKGIRLMERYETWFSKTVDNAKAKNFTTTTERYICEQACKDKKTIRGVERFLFGTDFPVLNPAMYVAGVFHEPLTPAERKAIFHDNFCRLTGFTTN